MEITKRQVEVKNLQVGMVLAEPIYDIDGKTLFSQGLTLNEKRIERIQHLDASVIFVEVEKAIDTVKDVVKDVAQDYVVDNASYKKTLMLNETREAAMNVVAEAFTKAFNSRSVKAEKVKLVVQRMIEAILQDDQIVASLLNLQTIDDYMLSHSINVCVLSLVTGISLGFSHKQLLELGSGALIHDIGKILVPQDILLKPEKLTEEEFEIVKKHTIYGYKILKDNMKMNEETSSIALSHHERIDGQGYPYGVSSNELSVYSKIVSVADVFDAITTDRVYCPKINHYEGMKYLIENVNTQFDFEITKKFITIIGYYPYGMYVKLTTGDIGKIISRKKSDPLIKISIDANGNKLKNYYEIDLYKNPSISIIDVNLEKYIERKAN